MKKSMREWILTGLLVSIIIIVFSAFASVALAQPVIDFVSPTPSDDSEISVDHLVINASVTSTENVSTLILNWNGTNHTMFCSGNISIASPYEIYGDLTIIGLQNGSYEYKVYANDTDGNWNVSETRVVTVNVTGLPKTGNMDGIGGVDLQDVILLARHVLISKTDYPIYADGDVDSSGGDPDLQDVILLARHVLISKTDYPLYP